MANTRKATKRARQADDRNERNTRVRSLTRTALKGALDAIKSRDLAKAQEAYKDAIRVIAKAASRGAIPKGRASRKVSRLTLLAKKTIPNFLPSGK